MDYFGVSQGAHEKRSRYSLLEAAVGSPFSVRRLSGARGAPTIRMARKVSVLEHELEVYDKSAPCIFSGVDGILAPRGAVREGQ